MSARDRAAPRVAKPRSGEAPHPPHAPCVCKRALRYLMYVYGGKEVLDRGPPPLSSTPSHPAPCRCSTRHASRAAPEGLEARAVECRKSWACFCRASTVAALRSVARGGRGLLLQPPRPASPACPARGVIDASSGAPRVGPPGAAPPMTMMTTTRTTVLAGRRAKGAGQRAKGAGGLDDGLPSFASRCGGSSGDVEPEAPLAPSSRLTYLRRALPLPSFLPSYLPSDFYFVSARAE